MYDDENAVCLGRHLNKDLKVSAIRVSQSVESLLNCVFEFHPAGDRFLHRKLSGSHHANYPGPSGILIGPTAPVSQVFCHQLVQVDRRRPGGKTYLHQSPATPHGIHTGGERSLISYALNSNINPDAAFGLRFDDRWYVLV